MSYFLPVITKYMDILYVYVTLWRVALGYKPRNLQETTFLLQEGQGQCPLFLDQRRTYSCPYQFILRQCNCQCTEKLKRPWNIRFEKQRTILLIQPNCQPRSPHRSLLKTCLCKRSSRNKLYPTDINGRDHILIHQLVYLVIFYFTSFLISPFSGNDPFLFFSFLF